MSFIIEYWQAIVGVALLLLGYVVLILLPELRKNDVKNVYQHAGEPRLLIQASELEKDFWARFEREKLRYLDSKNRWATVQTPVIPFPMNTAFEHVWFGKKYHVSTIGLSYADYLAAGVRFYGQMRAIWEKEIVTQFGNDTLMQNVKNQTPVQPENIWQQN